MFFLSFFSLILLCLYPFLSFFTHFSLIPLSLSFSMHSCLIPLCLSFFSFIYFFLFSSYSHFYLYVFLFLTKLLKISSFFSTTTKYFLLVTFSQFFFLTGKTFFLKFEKDYYFSGLLTPAVYFSKTV